MDYTTIGITVLWTFLFLYIIVASIDFGAGFFYLTHKINWGREKDKSLSRALLKSCLGSY